MIFKKKFKLRLKDIHPYDTSMDIVYRLDYSNYYLFPIWHAIKIRDGQRIRKATGHKKKLLTLASKFRVYNDVVEHHSSLMGGRGDKIIYNND